MVLLTVVPAAPKTSIGSIIRSAVVRADPMEIAAAARTAGNRRDGDDCLGLNFAPASKQDGLALGKAQGAEPEVSVPMHLVPEVPW